MGNTGLHLYSDSSKWLQGVISPDMAGVGADSSSRLAAEDAVFEFGRPLQERRLRPQLEQAQKCPRCESTDTKFCYYNNYSLSQPRHFCKTCRRYWTKGGTIRNVPVGGGCRKSTKKASRRPPEEFHNSRASPSSSALILNPEKNSFSSFPFSVFSPDQSNFTDLRFTFPEQLHFSSLHEGLFTPSSGVFMAAGNELSNGRLTAAACGKYTASFHDVCAPRLSLENTHAILESCHLMLPNSKILLTENQTHLPAWNSDSGKDSLRYNFSGRGS